MKWKLVPGQISWLLSRLIVTWCEFCMNMWLCAVWFVSIIIVIKGIITRRIYGDFEWHDLNHFKWIDISQSFFNRPASKVTARSLSLKL